MLPIFRVRVSGLSCWPCLVPGKTYWATSLRRARVGDFVVVSGAAIGESCILYVVKRVAEQNVDTLVLASTLSWSEATYTVPRNAVHGVLARAFLRACDTVQI
ncbi:MAG: hypothetical protein Q8R39_04270 [bacterium]|nr:hypothetical protein [bacterium]MDZ4284984.1 hypothetical protein [Patescibacteria group bacterium]